MALGALLATLAGPVAAQPAASAGCPNPMALTYQGDLDFPPYEYLDRSGQPAGFNVAVVRALAAAMSSHIDIRLITGVELADARARGAVELFTWGYLPARESFLDYLATTTPIRSSLLMLPGRASYPSRESGFNGLRIAIQQGTPSLAEFEKLPDGERPAIVRTISHRASLALLVSGQADAALGTGLTLRWYAAESGLTDPVEIPTGSRPYMLAVRDGCRDAMAPIAQALERLKAQGVIDQLADQMLAPPRNEWKWQHIAAIVASFAVLAAVAIAWIWTLRRTVRIRTQDLCKAKEAAEAASRATSTFLTTVSHEIRTPLNAVIGTAGLLEVTTLDAQQRELVEVVRSGGDTLLAIVNDVLDFAKIESGRLDLEQRPFDLPALVRRSIGLVEHAARRKGLRVDSTIGPNLPIWLLGDDTRLGQILLNLLSNAVKFTSSGAVRLDVVSEGSGERCQLRFDVRDTGIGIPAARVARLFQPFTQADSSTTRRFGGTGLGLAISRRLAELMDGSISVESVEGQGSTFTLRVVLARASAPEALGQAAIAPLPSMSPLRIVIAEDNKINQLVQRRLLGHLGYACDVVANGRELVEAMARESYDIVFLDMQMPEMDGLEAARRLKEQQPPDVYLIALTADVTTETRAACLAAGIHEYLSKPLTLDTLAATMARVEARRAGTLERAS
jgi:signal transduction histidine kinase/ActR/RegA family two-component response regulator